LEERRSSQVQDFSAGLPRRSSSPQTSGGWDTISAPLLPVSHALKMKIHITFCCYVQKPAKFGVTSARPSTSGGPPTSPTCGPRDAEVMKKPLSTLWNRRNVRTFNGVVEDITLVSCRCIWGY
jgi:hypothetical protein